MVHRFTSLTLDSDHPGEGMLYQGWLTDDEEERGVLLFDRVPREGGEVFDAPILGTGWPYTRSLLAGDVDGDGLDDLVSANDSAVLVNLSPLPNAFTQEDADLAWHVSETNPAYGVFLDHQGSKNIQSSALFDADMDGYSDLVAYTRDPRAYEGDEIRFAIDVWFGPYDAWRLGEAGDFAIAAGVGVESWYALNSQQSVPGDVVPVGDITGDGQVDLALSAAGAEDLDPTVWIVDSFEPGFFSTDDLGFGITSPRWAESHLTLQAHGAGDVTGDGQADLLLHDATETSSARIYLLPGPVDGPVELPGEAVWGAFAFPSSSYYQTYVDLVGDLNEDGLQDFALSASSFQGEPGVSYLFHGCENW